ITFESLHFACLSPERKDMEYSFCLKLSQYKDESWQYQTEDKALCIKYQVEQELNINIDDINNFIASAKVMDQDLYGQHVRAKLAAFNKLVYLEKRRGHLRFRRYCGQQRSVSMMANGILGPYKPSEILIVLGGAKRAMSGPFKRDQGVKVVRADEFQTSQVCAHCMSAQHQCSHKITAIEYGIPSSEKIEKLGEYYSHDVDHVVDNGVLNLALLDIHSREFMGQSDKEIHYQQNNFSEAIDGPK
ncbi:hypothetical protein HDU76_011046, partial [Blyttiomyces sp. JEL0837]